MDFTFKTVINNQNLEFEPCDEEPLLYQMKINEEWTLFRDINCDVETERMYLVKEYQGVLDSMPCTRTYKLDVYHGKDIKSETFMQELLENVLYLTQ
jgi:hypothetical protein